MKKLAAFLAPLLFATVAFAQGPGPGPTPNPWVVNGATLSYSQGGVVLPIGVTGGSQGVGTLNAQGLFINGVPVVATSSPVSSVFGRTGAVVSATNDYAFSQISGTLGNGQATGAYTGINGLGILTRATQLNLNGAAIQPPQSGALLQLEQANATAGRLEMDTFGAAGYNSTVRSDGTAASPTTLQAGDELGGFNAWGYNGTSIVGPNASFRTYAAQNWSVGANGTYADVATTPNGSTTLTEVEKWWQDGSVTIGAPTGNNEGIGTLIYANEYQQIRRAMKKDVRAIQLLTKNSVASEELVKRTRVVIEKSIGDFYIFETDKNPVACVALHQLEQGKAELACLYVSPSHENQGIGRKLIQFAEAKAREMGVEELITLSTQAFTYFQSKGGFTEGTPDDLPPDRREKYDQSGRNSKVLIKKFTKPS